MKTRFAPSPTGPLHLGHAYSAMLMHDMTRLTGGQFLLRMEDNDTTRAKPEWEALIVEDLTWLGVIWDGPIKRQSDQLPRYETALQRLGEMGVIYPCSCSRADIQAALSAPQEGVAHSIYPGTCRGRTMADRRSGDALRLDMGRALALLDGQNMRFEEVGAAFAGHHVVEADMALSTIGDVVLSRRGQPVVISYSLASALDDARDGITHVVRGEDLFDFTPLQVILQALLGLPTPLYHHHRLIRDETGKRLAKSDDARAISTYRAAGKSPADIRAMVGL